MSSLSYVEEDYLKAIFKISERSGSPVNTNAIARFMETTPASVTDMIKRLSEKDLIHYERYKGVSLKNTGNSNATKLIRKHRLWEVFLVEKLGFSWDEIHEVAEQLEHIRSEKLIQQLDQFLGFPKYDPHGDPIPDSQGRFQMRSRHPLTDVSPGSVVIMVGVLNHTTSFLQFLDSQNIGLGTVFIPLEKFEFDQSIRSTVDKEREIILTNLVAKNILVKNHT